MQASNWGTVSASGWGQAPQDPQDTPTDLQPQDSIEEHKTLSPKKQKEQTNVKNKKAPKQKVLKACKWDSTAGGCKRSNCYFDHPSQKIKSAKEASYDKVPIDIPEAESRTGDADTTDSQISKLQALND